MATSSSPAESLTVAVLGSARLSAPDPRHSLGMSVGSALASAGWAVMTGGYGGLMDAVASGATAAGGHVIGLPMSSWTGLSPSSSVAELRWCASYEERLGHLLAADAVVALDGGVGTLSELSVVWAAAQTEASAPAVVAVGPAWRSVLSVLATQLVVGPEDMALVTVVDTGDQVVDAVRSAVVEAPRLAAPRG